MIGEKQAKSLQESMLKISSTDIDVAALQEAYKNEPGKNKILSKVKSYKDNLGKMIGILYDAEQDPKKLPGSLLYLYRNLPEMENGIKEIDREMPGDISYKKNKIKRGHFVNNVYKALKAVKEYIKNNLSPELVIGLNKMYVDQLGAVKKDYDDFKEMVKKYVGDKIYFMV
jgi:hypothetical protein